MPLNRRERLWKAWGLCERHALGYLTIESSFRRGFVHGTAILYEDLMHRALPTFTLWSPLKRWQLARGHSDKGPCLMCEAGFGPETKGTAKPELVKKGRDLSGVITLARKTRPHWQKALCGKCLDDGSQQRCRRHLIEDLRMGLIDDLSGHYALVRYIARHVSKYARSFRFEYRDTETDEDKAALLSAVCWCSGWQLFVSGICSNELSDLRSTTTENVR